MKQRAVMLGGTLNVASERQRGVTIELCVPCKAITGRGNLAPQTKQ